MTDPIESERAALIAGLESLPPTPHVGDLLWVLGEPQRAQAVYSRAAQAGDPEAAVAGAITGHLSESVTSPPLVDVARTISAAAESGHNQQVRDQALELLAQLAALRLDDPTTATQVALQGVAHGSDRLYFVQPSAIPSESVASVVDGLLHAAMEGQTSPARTGKLLTGVRLAAAAGTNDAAWYERLLAIAWQGTEGILLFLVMSVLDRSELSSDGSTDKARLLDYLADRLRDPEERLVYRVRHLEGLARKHDVDEVTAAINALEDALDTPSRAMVLAHCQRAALSVGRFSLAAQLAISRAERTTDRELEIALLLQAETLHRLGGADWHTLESVTDRLIDALRRHEKAPRALLDHAYGGLEQTLISGQAWDRLYEFWADPNVAEILGPRRLARVFLREPDEPLRPRTADVPRVLSLFEQGAPPIYRRAQRALALVAEGWSALADHLQSDSATTEDRQLAAYVALFRRDQPAQAADLLLPMVAAGASAADTLLPAWSAAYRCGKLDQLLEAVDASPASSPARAAVAAAIHAAEGRLEIAREHAALITDSSPTIALWAGERLTTFGASEDEAERSGLSLLKHSFSHNAVASRAVEQAETALRRGDNQAAFDHLSSAAQQLRATDPEHSANLLVRADTVGPERPLDERITLLRDALSLAPESYLARFPLLRLLAERDAFAEVAGLLPDAPPPRITTLPVDAIRRAGRALMRPQPDLAWRCFSYLLRSALTRPDEPHFGDDLERLCEAAQKLGRLNDTRDLMERAVDDAGSDSQRGELNLTLGRIYAGELRDIDLAVEHLRRAMNAPSTRDRSARRLRTLLREQERWEELVEVLLTMSEYSPADERIAVLMTAADILWDRLGRPDSAAEALQLVLDTQPKHERALLRLSDYFAADEQWEQAVGHLETAARLVRDKAQRSAVYQKLGEIHQMHLEQPTLALENYLVSFICNSANRETFDRLERLYRAGHRYKDLAGLLDIAIETKRKDPAHSPFSLEELYSKRAQLEYRHLDAPRKAAESLVQALRISPTNDRYIRLLEAHLLDQADPAVILEAYGLHSQALPKDAPERVDLLRAQAELCDRVPGRQADAMGFYGRLLELDPSDQQAAKKLARAYKAEGRWDDLIGLYRGQLRWVTQPDETVAFYKKIARIYESELRNLPAAAEAYRELLKLMPGNTSSLRALGRLYEAMREWDNLIETSETEVKLVEDERVRAHLLFKIGSVYETHRSDEERAISYYERAVDHDPRCVPALHGLRDLYQRRDDTEKVLEYLKKETLIWDSSRERSSIHTRVAEVYWTKLRDADEAGQHLQKALELVPDSGPALQLLLDIYFEQERWALAAPIAYSLSQHPETMRADRRGELFLRRSIIAQHLGNRREAIDSLKIALDIAPDHAEAFTLLADILTEEGDADAHAEFFARLQKELLEREESAALGRVKRFLGRRAEDALQLRDAMLLYREAIGLDPDSIPALYSLVRVLRRQRAFQGAFEEAQAFATRALLPEVAQSARVIAAEILLNNLDDRDRARALLRAVLSDNPDHGGALFLDAQAAYLAADWPTARANMERLVHLDIKAGRKVSRATRSEHVFYLGRILEAGFGDTDEALSCYALAREANPVDARPLKAAAGILVRQRNWLRLDTLLDRALKGAESLGGPTATPPFLLLAAKVSAMQGQRERAESYLKRALDAAPDHEEARAQLVDLVGSDAGGGEHAAEELRALLEHNPLDRQALEGLSKVFARDGRPAAAACLDRVVGLLDPAAGQALPARRLSQTLTPDLMTLLEHPGLDSGYLRLLRLIGPHLGQLGLASQLPPPMRSQAPDEATQAGLTQLITRLGRICPIQQAEIRCFEEGPRGTGIATTVAQHPIVTLEMDCREALSGNAQGVFLLGHALFLIRRGTYSLIAAPRADLTGLLFFLSEWARSGSSEPPHDNAPWRPAMPPQLTRALAMALTAQDRPLEPLQDPQHAQRLAISLQAAATAEADRFGLCLCGDLLAGVNAVLRIEIGVDLEMLADRADELARSHRLMDLLRYAVSPQFLALQEALSP